MIHETPMAVRRRPEDIHLRPQASGMGHPQKRSLMPVRARRRPAARGGPIRDDGFASCTSRLE